MLCRVPALAIAMVIAFLGAGVAPALADLASPWIEGYNVRTRLSAGRAEWDGANRLLAFVEIELLPGWKTYWRTPGDAGGLPPRFDWSKSTNLSSARVRYPAPKRFVDKSGNTIGYKGHATFPVEILLADDTKPMTLALALQFGICKDICVPVDAELALDVPAGLVEPADAAGLATLELVPRAEDARRPADPRLTRTEAHLDGDMPRLILEAEFPGGGDGADIFLEAPDGLYLPLPERKGEARGDRLIFETDLTGDVDLAALKGKPLAATIVSDKGQSVATFNLE